jgi:hypothetical protein
MGNWVDIDFVVATNAMLVIHFCLTCFAVVCMDLADKVARPVSTAIYFLLPTGAVSCLHRIPCAEVWHFYAGEPLTVSFFWYPISMSFFHNQLQPIFLGKMEVPSCRF